MFDIFRYAYLIGDLIFLSVWLLLFLRRPDFRRRMLIMSTMVAPMGPLSEIFYRRDYWRPELFSGQAIGIEDLLFGFAIGGIAGVIYECLLGKRFLKRHSKVQTIWMFVVAIFGITWMFVGNIVLGFNSIYVSTTGFLVVGFLVILRRKDLLGDALLSGLFMGGNNVFILFNIWEFV